MLLKDKVALITGGAKGMGEATSLKFAEQGAKVIIADLNIDAAKETAEKINEQKGTARAYAQVDVTDKDSIKNTVDKTMEEFGKIDVLINFAGGTFGSEGTTENINMDDWDKTIDLNLNGTIYPILEVLPHMK